MSAPGGIRMVIWQAGSCWHWLLKNLLEETVEHGTAKKKSLARSLAQEARSRHSEAALTFRCPEKFKRKLEMGRFVHPEKYLVDEDRADVHTPGL
jgi:hypothetical protein